MLRNTLLAIVLLLSLSSLSYADKTADANIASCKDFYSAINKGDFKVFDKLVSDDFVDHEKFPGNPGGKEGLMGFFKMMRTAFPDFKVEPDFFMADGDRVAMYLTMSGTHKGEFMGFPATGKKFSIQMIDIVRIKDGKAVEHWGVTDGMAMMEQLGAMGPH